MSDGRDEDSEEMEEEEKLRCFIKGALTTVAMEKKQVRRTQRRHVRNIVIFSFHV